MAEKKTYEAETLDSEFFGDQKLMAKIEENVSGGIKDKIIESLDLFERNWQNLPSGPASDFIQDIMESEDTEIKEKAEEVYANSLKESDDRLKKEIRRISNDYNSIILPIQSQMNYLATSFNTAKQMANIVNKVPHRQLTNFSGISPTIKKLVELNKTLIESRKHIVNTQNLAMPLLLQPSPILRAENLFSKITDTELDSHKLFSDILEKKDEDIDFISGQNKDFTFNFPAYELLCNLEIYLRLLINKIIIEPNAGNLKNKIPVDILTKWEKRKDIEENNSLSDGEYELIDYSDFTDIKIIFEKRNIFKLFKGIFSQEQFKSVTSKLHELDPIRKKIAHFRPISEADLNRLILYSDDILSN